MARPQRRQRASSADGGFGLVELLIVMVIIAVLMAVAATAMQASKRAARLKQAVAAAHAYNESISAYMLEHGNQPPRTGRRGRREWPILVNGPIDMVGRPYLRGGVPEQVARWHAGNDPRGTQLRTRGRGVAGRTVIRYVRGVAPNYTLIVYDEEARLHCYLGPAPPAQAGAARC